MKIDIKTIKTTLMIFKLLRTCVQTWKSAKPTAPLAETILPSRIAIPGVVPESLPFNAESFLPSDPLSLQWEGVMVVAAFRYRREGELHRPVELITMTLPDNEPPLHTAARALCVLRDMKPHLKNVPLVPIRFVEITDERHAKPVDITYDFNHVLDTFYARNTYDEPPAPVLPSVPVS